MAIFILPGLAGLPRLPLVPLAFLAYPHLCPHLLVFPVSWPQSYFTFLSPSRTSPHLRFCVFFAPSLSLQASSRPEVLFFLCFVGPGGLLSTLQVVILSHFVATGSSLAHHLYWLSTNQLSSLFLPFQLRETSLNQTHNTRVAD